MRHGNKYCKKKFMNNEPTPKTYLASLNGALHAMMEADERVLIIGEDILDP